MEPASPEARAISSRCGHSTSTGARPRNNGPGKSPFRPIPDWPIASSMTISARRSASVVEENGFTSTKSMVPAIRVFSPWVEKRRMVLIPDSPAVIFAQFSVLPSPSDVITPMPVTTTIGRLWPSRVVVFALRSFVDTKPVSGRIVIRRPRRAPFLRRANDRRPRPLSGPASGRLSSLGRMYRLEGLTHRGIRSTKQGPMLMGIALR